MSIKQEKVIKGLRCCGRGSEGFPQMCSHCPYNEAGDFPLDESCKTKLINDVYTIFIKSKKEEDPVRSTAKNPIYVFQIAKKEYEPNLFDDEIPKEKLLVDRSTNSVDILLHFWKMYLEEYIGYMYCIKELKKNKLIISGILKASDNSKLQEYFNNMED